MREERVSGRARQTGTFSDLGSRYAIQQHQIEASITPQRSSAEFVKHELPITIARAVKRNLRNDPLLAKHVNDTLAQRVERGA